MADAGAPERVALTRAPLDPGALLALVADPGHGGTCLFLGTTRPDADAGSVAALDYEAYEEMAPAELARVADDAEARFGARVAIVHRLGRVPVGEASVAIAASAPHRGAAFDACRLAIDLLKQDVPIWKREVAPDGGGAWRDGVQKPA